eukprot:2272747-Amphidinium_carterae.1
MLHEIEMQEYWTKFITDYPDYLTYLEELYHNASGSEGGHLNSEFVRDVGSWCQKALKSLYCAKPFQESIIDNDISFMIRKVSNEDVPLRIRAEYASVFCQVITKCCDAGSAQDLLDLNVTATGTTLIEFLDGLHGLFRGQPSPSDSEETHARAVVSLGEGLVLIGSWSQSIGEKDQQTMCEALGSIKHRSSRHLLMKLMYQSNCKSVRRLGVNILQGRKSQAKLADELMQKAKHSAGDSLLLLSSACALAQLGNDAAAKVLARLAIRSSSEVRKAAVDALGELLADDSSVLSSPIKHHVIHVLSVLAADEADMDVQWASICALRKLDPATDDCMIGLSWHLCWDLIDAATFT